MPSSSLTMFCRASTSTIPSATVKVPTLRAAAVRGIPQLIVEQDVRVRGVKAALRYADRAMINLVVIVGERERAEGTVVLRDMRSRQETVVPFGDVVDVVRRQLA